MKIGFGVGKVKILHVGGINGRAEYVPIGTPLSQAFEAEHLAPAGGVIIIPKVIKDMVNKTFETELIQADASVNSANGPFYYVKRQTTSSLMIKAAALLLRSSLERNQLLLLKKCVKTYISSSLLPYVDYDLEGWFSNLDHVTTMFASIGVDLGQIGDASGLNRFNDIICIIQKCILQTGGSLNKLLMDDKGTTLICIWNAHSHHTQESGARAVCGAKQFKKELGRIGVNISMGLATGKVFAGIVGASGGRREYSILGDGVNLSARLMQAACKSKTTKILLDERTMMLASSRVLCNFNESIMVKGKSVPINTYYPVDSYDQLNDLISQKLKMPNEIERLSEAVRHSPEHINIYKIPTDEKNGKKLIAELGDQIKCLEKNKSVMFKGRLKASDKFMKAIKIASKQESSAVIVISGSMGVGKSHFLKQNLENLIELSTPCNFYLNYFSIEPHQYFERGGTLLNVYSHLVAAVRVHTSNYRDSEEDVVRNLVESHFGQEKVDQYSLDKLSDFVESMSYWRIPDIKYSSTRYTKNVEVFELACLIFEALVSFISEVAWEGSKAKPYVLAIDWANMLNEKEIKVLKHVAETLKIGLVLIYTTDFQEKPPSVKLDKLISSLESKTVCFEHLELKALDLVDSLALCNKFTSICYNVDVPMDPDMAEYIFDKGHGKPLHILSMINETSERGYLEVSNNVLAPSEAFKQKADMAIGEHYLVTPPSLAGERIYLLDQLQPIDNMVDRMV